ncbi:hypothetical protein SEA_JUJU_33 [Gordonia phage JuJu]|uniref:Uncharacterized protein n=1 Tax=Gordonia phage JuJu TaxID=2590929 RepID=A0A516KR31_9CAUD|nr:hypothetical protein KNU69_gp33 [Gordonia phage JuJu]QDP44149.1 hypothetical protein SEA_JUJU_33 [Gordonia phage JuJu]
MSVRDFRQYVPMTAKRPVSQRNLMNHLVRQLGFLERSSEAFDDGQVDEALRLSTTIRILVHDTKASRSLLGQLGVKMTMRFWDTARYETDIAKARTRFEDRLSGDLAGKKLVTDIPPGILMPSFERREWVAPLRAAPGVWERVNHWWQTPMLRSTEGNVFTRKDLVCTMANQDGGAHVDPTIDAHYDDLANEYFGLEFADPGLGLDLDSLDDDDYQPALGYIAAHCVRQIAEEVICAIRRQWPELAPDGWVAPESATDTARGPWLLNYNNPMMPLVIGVPYPEP